MAPVPRAGARGAGVAWLWLAASAAIHVGVAAALVVGARPAPDEAPTSGALHGDALVTDPSLEGEVDVDPTPPDDLAPTEAPDDPSLPGPADAPTPPRAPAVPRATRHRAARAHAAQGGAPATPPVRFGAVGDRAAVDLATAFTRGFPQTASADPVWARAPLGDAGTATVTLELDDAGQLVSARVTGAPSPALRRGIERTLALLRGRAFTAGGRVTTMHLAARVSPDEVHDGLHGDVFALGGSYASREGSAFFALAIGRRIDLTVRASR